MAILQGTIEDIHFQSKELQETCTIFVYKPPAFSPLTTYSVLIVQDGKDYFQLGRLPRYADELSRQQKIDNLIIFAIPYNNIEDRRSKYHPEGVKNQAYIRFLAHELVPWIDKNYPTAEMADSRTLMGDSLAGTVSLMTAIAYPNIFGRVILHSPYVDENVLDAVRNIPTSVTLNGYHVIGKEETSVKISNNRDFLTPNRELNHLLNRKGFHFFYEEFAGGHSWKFWQPDVKRALEKMFS